MKSFPRLLADFEPQKALVVSVSDWQPHHAYVLKQIVEKTRGHVDLLILHNDLNQRAECMKWLEPLKGKRDHVLFHQLELNTIWMRDFCPLFARQENGSLKAFDFYYEGVRPKDDRLPKTWSERTACQWEKVEWTLQGGNLISNGAYLGVATTRIFQDNYIRFPNPRRNMNVEYERRKMVVDAITKPLNLRELVILEPLQSEATPPRRYVHDLCRQRSGRGGKIESTPGSRKCRHPGSERSTSCVRPGGGKAVGGAPGRYSGS